MTLSVSNPIVRRVGTLVVILAYLAGSLLLARGSLYYQGIILTAAVFAILATSLNLAAGTTGLFSLGHAGLFAFGAFATTILRNDHPSWNLFVILVIVMIGVGLVGALVGVLSLRVSGLYFAATTFVFTVVVSTLASQLTITGGPQGLNGPLLAQFPSSLSFLGDSATWSIMLALLATLVLVAGIRKSPLYPVLLSIRDAEPFAASAGVRTSMTKVGIFGLSAALAGLAGWCFSLLGVVSYGQFDWTVSANILVMVLFGGINTLIGPVIGAAIISIYPAYIAINPLFQEVVFGILLLVVILILPQGLIGLGQRLVRLVAARGISSGAYAVPGASADVPAGADVENTAIDPTQDEGPSWAERVKAITPLSGGDSAVRCEDIVFSYGRNHPAVDGVSMTVQQGTIHGLIGPNGSGKSTLVDLIAGRQHPRSGKIWIGGVASHKAPAHRRARLGLRRTFQTVVLVGELSHSDNVITGLYSRIRALALRAPFWSFLPGSRKEQRALRVASVEALEWAGLHGQPDHLVDGTPHGQQQLVQLGAAYASQPNTLVLDEPLAGLSPAEVDHVGHLLANLKAAGVSVILIEHQTNFVFSICDHVTVLNAGQVVATGTPDQVLTDPKVREVYLGL